MGTCMHVKQLMSNSRCADAVVQEVRARTPGVVPAVRERGAVPGGVVRVGSRAAVEVRVEDLLC